MMNIQKINQIGVPVKDINRAVSFYKALSLPLLFSTDTMAFFDCDGIRILLSLPEKMSFHIQALLFTFKLKTYGKPIKNSQMLGYPLLMNPILLQKWAAPKLG